MGKVRSEDRRAPVHETIDVRPKKRKRKKDLEKLRRNVLEAKRNLCQRGVPSKIWKTSFAKALNHFADQRQANDNKAQGIDSKGNRAARKTVCSRLLPSLTTRKDIGIFAKGAKGGEIKRASLTLNESNRARLQGDVQKLLYGGNLNGKESIQNNFKNISRELLDENCAVDNPGLIPRAQISPVLGKVNGAKRKLFVAAQQPERALKKLELKTTVREDPASKTKVTKGVQEEEKYRRRLFEDDEKELEAIDQFDVEELRFSPETAETEIPAENSNAIHNEERVKRGNEKTSLNFQNFYWAPTTRYEDLCAMVCAENFENCFQDVPYTDPLKKTRKTLMNIYADTCQRHLLRKKVRAGEQDEVRSSTLSDQDDGHPSVAEDKGSLLGSNVEVEACAGNDSEDSSEFPNDEIILNPKKKNILKKRTERMINQDENELFVAALDMSFDPGCGKTHMEKLWNKEVKSSQLAVNVPENPADDRTLSTELENNVKRVSRRKRKHVITQNANMSDVQDLHTASLKVHTNVETPKILRFNLSQKSPSELESMNPTNVNVPKSFSRGDLIMRFLEDVQVRKPNADARSVFPEETFPLPAPERAPTKRYLGDPLRRHEVGCEVPRRSLEIDEDVENPEKISAVKNVGTRNEKHVPAILRRSGCRGLTRYKSENAECIATLLSRELEISNAGSSRDDVTESQHACGKENERRSGIAFSKDSPIEGILANQMAKDPRSLERGTFQTPSVMNMFNERNEHVLKSKRNFMNAKYKTTSRILVREADRNESLPNEIFVQAQTSDVPNDHGEFTVRERLKKVRNVIQRQNSHELKCSEGQSKKILIFEKKDLRNCQRFCDVGLVQRHETTKDGTSILNKVKFVQQDPCNVKNFIVRHPSSDSSGIHDVNDFMQQNPQDTCHFVHQQQSDVRMQNSQGFQNFVYKAVAGCGTNDDAQNVQFLTFENLQDPSRIRSFVHRDDPVPQNGIRQNVTFENRNSQNLQNRVLKETNDGQNLQILTFNEHRDPLMMRDSIHQQGTSHNLQSFVQRGVPDNAVQNHTRYSRSFGSHSGVQDLQVLTLGKQTNPHKMPNVITGKLQGVSPISQRAVQPTKFMAYENYQNPHRIPIYVRTESQSDAPLESSSRLVNFDQKQDRTHLFVEQTEPKILSIANRNFQSKDRLVCEQQVQIPMPRGNFQNSRVNAETDFLKYSHAATERTYSQENVYDTTNRKVIHRLMQDGQPYQNGVQNLEYPMIVYQGDDGMDMSSVKTDKIGCDGTSDVMRNEMFQNGVYQDGSQQYQPRFGTDPNFDERSNAPKRIKLMNRKVGLFVPRNGSFQNVSQNQVPLVKCNTLCENNNNFEFTFDPSCPPAGYKRSQVEENDSQIYQRLIQPVYNVVGTYPQQPAVPNYFPPSF